MAGAFNPKLITDPKLNPLAALTNPAPSPAPMAPEAIAPAVPQMAAPVQPAPAPQPVFIPVPIRVPAATSAKSLNVSADSARKAQGIYPAEQQAKQAQINNAKAPPSPTGAWGAPQ